MNRRKILFIGTVVVGFGLLSLLLSVSGCRKQQSRNSSSTIGTASQTTQDVAERITYDSIEGSPESDYQAVSLCELVAQTDGTVGAYEVVSLYSLPTEPEWIHAPLDRQRSLAGQPPDVARLYIAGGPSATGNYAYPELSLAVGETVVVFLRPALETREGVGLYDVSPWTVFRDPDGDGKFTDDQGLFTRDGDTGATIDEIEMAVQKIVAETASGGECVSDVHPPSSVPVDMDAGGSSDVGSPDAGSDQ